MSLGVIINSLNSSTKAYQLLKNAPDCKEPVIVFYQNLAPPCLPLRVPIMQCAEIYGFHGNLISTCLSTAEQLITLPTNYNKIFYVWDLEWTQRQYHSQYLYNIYRNDSLKIVARCDDHAEMISKVFNVDVEVIENFNLNELKDL
jgi:hypothetical protein